MGKTFPVPELFLLPISFCLGGGLLKEAKIDFQNEKNLPYN